MTSRHVWGLVISLCLLAPGLSFSDGNMRGKETLISLLIIRHDRVTDRFSKEILIIGRYANDRYQPVTGYDSPGRVAPVRSELLKRHQKYVAFHRGRSFGEMVVKGTVVRNFHCDALDVGVGRFSMTRKDFSPRPRNAMVRIPGYKSAGESSPRSIVFVALNSSAPAVHTQHRARPLDLTLTQSQTSSVLALLVRRYKRIPDCIVNLRTTEAYDFDGDGLVEHLVVATAGTKANWDSSALVLRFGHNAPLSLLSEMSPRYRVGWGKGYQLLDAIDIDGDSVPELVFQVEENESVEYEIYAFKKDGFQRVLHIPAYGC